MRQRSDCADFPPDPITIRSGGMDMLSPLSVPVTPYATDMGGMTQSETPRSARRGRRGGIQENLSGAHQANPPSSSRTDMDQSVGSPRGSSTNQSGRKRDYSRGEGRSDQGGVGPTPAVGGIPAMIQNAKSIADACDTLDRYLRDTFGPSRIGTVPRSEDFHELYMSFRELLFKLFSVDKSRRGWIERSLQSRRDYESVMHLLAPNGLLMQALILLRTDEGRVFDVPIARLPLPARRCFERNDLQGLGPFYQSRMGYLSPQGHVTLNMFEYYIFWMSFSLLSDVSMPSGSSSTSSVGMRITSSITHAYQSMSRSSSSDPLLDLLQEYLHYLMPHTNVDGRLALQHASPKRTPSRATSLTAGLTPRRSASPATTTTPIYLNDDALQWNAPHSIPVQFLLVIIEFWLQQNSFDPLYDPSSLQRNHAEYVVPSKRLLRAIRVLTTHLVSDPALADLTVAPAQPTSPVSPRLYNSAPQVGLTLPLQIIRKPMFFFLRLAFLNWPLDSRMPLHYITAIWLTYIQPWVHQRSSEPTASPTDADSGRYSERWRGYIVENFLFYRALFDQFLQMSLQFDFQDKHMTDLTQVEKVLTAFSSTLMNTLRDLEAKIYDNQHAQQRSPQFLINRTHDEGDKLRSQLETMSPIPVLQTAAQREETATQLVKLIQSVRADLRVSTPGTKSRTPTNKNDIDRKLEKIAARIVRLLDTKLQQRGALEQDSVFQTDFLQSCGRPVHQPCSLQNADGSGRLCDVHRVALGQRKCTNYDVPVLETLQSPRSISSKRPLRERANNNQVGLPPASNESAAAVKWTTQLSEYIQREYRVSVNLRPLASYPNMVFIVLMVLAVWQIVFYGRAGIMLLVLLLYGGLTLAVSRTKQNLLGPNSGLF